MNNNIPAANVFFERGQHSSSRHCSKNNVGRVEKKKASAYLNNNSAQTLVVVIAVLAILFVIGAAFFILSQAERVAGVRHIDSIRARYISEAGVVFAEKIINLDRQQSQLIDTLQDITANYFYGTDVDINQDGTPDARWVEVKDIQGNTFGRFAVKITDEASKINVNTSTQAVLESLFIKTGIDSSRAKSIIDGRPFFALEQLGGVLKKNEFSRGKDFITCYGRDFEIGLNGNIRMYLNSASPNMLAEEMLSRGVRDAYQKAANLKDAQDTDCVQTIVDKFSATFMPASLADSGGWRKINDFYESGGGGAAGKFTWNNMSLADGEYYCICHGILEGEPVGTVTLEGETSGEYLFSGEGLVKKVKIQGGSFSLAITPDSKALSHFKNIELIGAEPATGLTRKVMTGTDALVINETMIKPAQDLTGASTEIPSGETYNCTLNIGRSGTYYVAPIARTAGGFVGDITVNGHAQSGVYDKEYLDSSINTSGEFTVQIKNNSLHSASFQGLHVSQQPDAEYVEILNLSPQEIDLSDYTLEVYTPAENVVPGWPATIPKGTKIAAYQYLVLAVDKDDASGVTPKLLVGSKISFRGCWGFDAVGMTFENKDTINKEYDLLPDSGARIVLRNNFNEQVDSVEYRSAQVASFIALERPDPSTKTDLEGNGYFDGWYPSEAEEKATPGTVNENWGMYIDKVKHTPSEVKVFNRALVDLAETQQISSGENWKKTNIYDIARIIDRVALNAVTLVLKGNFLSGDFKLEGANYVSVNNNESGTWEFAKVPQGAYNLSILSNDYNASGQKMQVSLKINTEGEFRSPSQIIMNQGIALFGSMELVKEPSTFQLKIVNGADKKISIKEIRLEPVNTVVGRVNVNTAKEEVLGSIFNNNSSLTQLVLKNRPIGLKDGRKLGLGDLIMLDTGFLSYTNSLTLRSDTYEILCHGEYAPTGARQSFQTVRTVIERGE